MTTEESKAVQEVAKATGKALDRAGDLGGWVDRVFGDLIEDGAGVVADRIKYYRIEQALLLRDKVERRLKERGIAVTIPVPPRIGVRLIEEATISDSSDLHTKWANLLTNAMDPNYRGKITRRFVSILADLEPIDAHILDGLVKEWSQLSEDKRDSTLFGRSNVAKGLSLTEEDTEVALRNLMRLGLIKPGVVTGGISMGEHRVSAYKDTEMFQTTTLGIKFSEAVN